MMQNNYVFVPEASLIDPLVRCFPTNVSSHFLPPARNRYPGSPVFEETSLAEEEAKPVALVVDDVADVTEMLSVFLTLAGYEVVTAESAQAAIAAAQAKQFDVVVSDIGMPEMNGYELARALRVLPGYEAVPMVALTGFCQYDDRERSLRAGFNAHLTKPIDPNVLFELIERLRG